MAVLMRKNINYSGMAMIHNRIVKVLNSEARKLMKKYNYTKAESYKLIGGVVKDIVG